MKPGSIHTAEIFGTRWRGLFGTRIESDSYFGTHSHATFSLGLIERGAQCSASGSGPVAGVRAGAFARPWLVAGGSFDVAEDALHDAFIAASERLLREGVPVAAQDALSRLFRLSK
jgi:hypothetical protein